MYCLLFIVKVSDTTGLFTQITVSSYFKADFRQRHPLTFRVFAYLIEWPCCNLRRMCLVLCWLYYLICLRGLTFDYKLLHSKSLYILFFLFFFFYSLSFICFVYSQSLYMNTNICMHLSVYRFKCMKLPVL